MCDKISFAIGIPTINRWDLLKHNLRFYKRDFPGVHIQVIDNGKQGIDEAYMPNCNVFCADENLGVATSWNLLIQKIFDLGHSHAIILNDDIYWGKNKLDVLELLNHHKDGFFLSEESFSVFIISKATWEKVGLFDQRFYPAYFEDMDYLYRMRIAGIKIYKSIQLNPQILRQSSSVSKDASLLRNKGQNELYYMKKWGGKVGYEKFSEPFDKKNNSILNP